MEKLNCKICKEPLYRWNEKCSDECIHNLNHVCKQKLDHEITGQYLKIKSNNSRTQRLALEKTLALLKNPSQTLTWMI